jgi:hypothetical protein
MTSKFCTANPYLQISYSDGNLGRVMFTKNVRVAITVTALVIDGNSWIESCLQKMFVGQLSLQFY